MVQVLGWLPLLSPLQMGPTLTPQADGDFSAWGKEAEQAGQAAAAMLQRDGRISPASPAGTAQTPQLSGPDCSALCCAGGLMSQPLPSGKEATLSSVLILLPSQAGVYFHSPSLQPDEL